ncbi:hypothetical protein [Shimia sp.]|uniref:hypothetical protein n=1 Tax=Shimia sp. TaxID=1954381 RepID=UPI0032984928
MSMTSIHIASHQDGSTAIALGYIKRDGSFTDRREVTVDSYNQYEALQELVRLHAVVSDISPETPVIYRLGITDIEPGEEEVTTVAFFLDT